MTRLLQRDGRLLPAAIALVVTAVMILMAGRLGGGARPLDAFAYALLVVSGLSLALYRTRPVVALVVSMVTHFLYIGMRFPEGLEWVSILIALLLVTQQGKWRWTVAAALLNAVALITADVTRGPGLEGDTAPAVISMTTAILLGLWLRARSDLIAEARERAERAERTKEEEARRRVDEERLRIAREVHDTVAHSIATINVQAGTAVHVIDKRPEQAVDALVAIKQASAEAMRELRSTLGMLRGVDGDPRSPSPRLAQVDNLVQMAQNAGLQTDLEILGERRDLPSSIDLAAYRIVQESVTNIIRHADATRITITITYGPRALEVHVEDDGRAPAAIAPGSGIDGMRERTEILGGSFEAGPRSVGGFAVRAVLPTRIDA